MKDFSKRGRLTFQVRFLAMFVAALGAAMALACLAAMVTFPLLEGLPGQVVLEGVAATALLVSLPVILVLTFLTARFAGQKRDLATREELFVTAQEIGKLGYWQYDVRTGEFKLSDNVHHLIGDPHRQLRMSLPVLLDMVHPDDRELLTDALRRIIVDGTCEESEYRITGLDGIEKTFWVDGKRMLDRAGKPLRAYGACQDITERKLIEAALRESEDHYRHAVELNAQIPWTADPAGNLLEIGPRWVDLVGMGRAESLGVGWIKALHPEDRVRALRVWAEALRTGEPYDAEYRFGNGAGSYRWFRACGAARRGEGGEIIRWYGMLEDIHDRRTADAALRESEAFARRILESTPDCVKVIDLQGNVQFINTPGLLTMEIEDFAPLKGRQWAGFWPEEARAKIEKALDGARRGAVTRFSGFCPTAKGTPKWWDVSVSPIPGPDGRPARLLATSRDMTAARRTQDELECAIQVAEKTAQRLENVLSSTTDCVITFDNQLRIAYLNRSAQDAVARDRDLLGLTLKEAFPEIGSSPYPDRLQRAFAGQVPVHFEGFFAPYDRWLNVHLYPSADGISAFFKDVTERRRAQEQLLYLAHHDTLTGLVNRTILHEQLSRFLAAATPARQTALLFLDLDEFKSINDSLGHSAGDRLLLQVSLRLKCCVRATDIVARFGGDEFAVVAEVSGPQEAALMAERIIRTLDQPYDIDGHVAAVGASMGIVTIADSGVAADDALRDADIALYRAKAEGRGTYRVFEAAMGQSFQDRESLKQDLRGALARGEFSIEYQPLIDLGSNRVNGFEALLRWKHPVRGMVPPSVFIPVAEETGLIVEIGEWVLGRTCRDAATWPSGISLAVNLSPVQFRTGNLMETVSRSLSESGLPGKRLQLEITESVLLADSVSNLEVLHGLRMLGVAIAMDDFGTGYSSLSYLRSFPFDKIKIDRAFVSDISAEAGTGEPNAIVRAIIDLAQSLGITTTAEGVETGSQLMVLRAMGCDEVQGFLFSRPVGADKVVRTVAHLNGQKGEAAPLLRVVS